MISIFKTPDFVFSHIYLKFFQEKNALIVVTFHGVFLDESEHDLNLVDPLLWITLDEFKQFIEYYLHNHYVFISPQDILNGLDTDKKYIMITFDDGYFNNYRVVPILQEYQIPATFFISTDYILNNKCFWWDVLYKQRTNSGIPVKKIRSEINQLKTKKTEDIETYLEKNFGKKAFRTSNDIDRPFTPSELKRFSKEKYVFLGNHTNNHAILTNYSSDEIKSQIQTAQNNIYDITGLTPIAISYPNGNHSPEILKITKKTGLKLGFTVEPKKNLHPINCKDTGCLHLNRFVYTNCIDIKKHCELIRSDITIYSFFGKKLGTS